MNEVFLSSEIVELIPVREEHSDFARELFLELPIQSNPNWERAKYEDDLMEYLDSSDSECFIIRTQDDEKIGIIELRSIDPVNGNANIQLTFSKEADKKERNQYGKSAVNLITDFATNQLGINRIEAGILEDDHDMIRFFEDMGFTKEGTFRERFFLDGEYKDQHIYRQ